MNWLTQSWHWVQSKLFEVWRVWNHSKPKRHVVRIIEADTPPEILTGNEFVLAREDGEDWAIAFLCPCGCKDRLELALIPEVRPRWTLNLDEKQRPTLHPSVWRKDGCRAHFWVRDGEIIWCE